MKNIKVTYKYTNPSRILNNLLLPKPESITTISVFEYQNISDETANKLVEELNKLDFVVDYQVVNRELLDKELATSSVG